MSLTSTIDLMTGRYIGNSLSQSIDWCKVLEATLSIETEGSPVVIWWVACLSRHFKDEYRPLIVRWEDLELGQRILHGKFRGWLRSCLGRIPVFEEWYVHNILEIANIVELDHISSLITSRYSISHVSHTSTFMHRVIAFTQNSGWCNKLNMDIQILRRVAPG